MCPPIEQQKERKHEDGKVSRSPTIVLVAMTAVSTIVCHDRKGGYDAPQPLLHKLW